MSGHVFSFIYLFIGLHQHSYQKQTNYLIQTNREPSIRPTCTDATYNHVTEC